MNYYLFKKKFNIFIFLLQWIKLGPKSFHCRYCNKEFNRKSNLVAHLRIHTGEKPYTCPYCPHAANDTGNLKRHIANKHQKGSYIIICIECINHYYFFVWTWNSKFLYFCSSGSSLDLNLTVVNTATKN